MSDKCELCGGDVCTSRDGQDKCCAILDGMTDCACNHWTTADQFDRIQTALAMLKRVETGEFAETVAAKVKAQYPGVDYLRQQIESAINEETKRSGE